MTSVRTDALVRRYGPGLGVLGVDLDVPAGGVFGLVGPNGAGKTTLLGLLSGLRRPDAGTITMSPPAAGVALVPDTPTFEPWLTATETVALSASLAGQALSAAGARVALDEVGLSAAADRRVAGFSRGMAQRLGLAAARVTGAGLYLLDEPTAGLDPAGRAEVLDLVQGWGVDATVVLSSHVLDDVQRVCEHVCVIGSGQILYQGPTAELLERHVRPAWRVRVRGSVATLTKVLTAQPWVRSCEAVGPEAVRVVAQSQAEGERGIVAAVAGLGVRLSALEPESADLEAAFLALTGADGSAGEPAS